MTYKEIPQYLEASPLLCRCGIDPCVMSLRTCRCGQIISDRQEGRICVGLVAVGTVDVFSVALDGRDVLLNTLKAGDCFGISNLFNQEELETVLRCREDTTLIFIPKSDFIAALEHNNTFALTYASLCNQKLQFLIRRIELLTMQSCKGKIIEYILSQQNESGLVIPGCSREDLARHLGVSRAALFREFSYLSTQGLLALKNGTILVLNKEGLENILFRSS